MVQIGRIEAEIVAHRALIRRSGAHDVRKLRDLRILYALELRIRLAQMLLLFDEDRIHSASRCVHSASSSESFAATIWLILSTSKNTSPSSMMSFSMTPST